jgi:hypothetical protein
MLWHQKLVHIGLSTLHGKIIVQAFMIGNYIFLFVNIAYMVNTIG